MLRQDEIVSTWVSSDEYPKADDGISKSSLSGFNGVFFKPTKMGCLLSLLYHWTDDCFGEFVLWKAVDCEINSGALFYDNYLASDCFELCHIQSSQYETY